MKIDKNSKLGLFLGHVMPGVVRPLHVLWHEVIGFLFLVFAVWLGSSAIRTFHTASSGRILMSIFLPALLAYFGITSFLRARKIAGTRVDVRTMVERVVIGLGSAVGAWQAARFFSVSPAALSALDLLLCPSAVIVILLDRVMGALSPESQDLVIGNLAVFGNAIIYGLATYLIVRFASRIRSSPTHS